MKKYFIPTFRLPFSWKEKLLDKVVYQPYKYFNGVYKETGILVTENQLNEIVEILSLKLVSQKMSAEPDIIEVTVRKLDTVAA
ncbi:MAG: hypothetical protein V4665_01130 [Patescibacteria group bacterium]